MDWDKLRVFHAVAEAGSFTHAGEKLNLSQSAVSRQISGLEESLKISLFHRHARGLLLTEQGELLYNTAHDVFAKLAMAEAQLAESREDPRGPLTVTTTVAFGSVWLTPRIQEFLEEYPDIDLTIILGDTELDLSMRQADVAIRLAPPKQADLIQRHLATLTYSAFAAPEYLKEHGAPAKPEDLDNHRLVVYGDARTPLSGLNFLLEAGADPKNPRTPVLKVNSIYGIFRAVQGGLGIGALPDYMNVERNNLVRVLPELPSCELDAFFVYPEELRNSKRIGVFRDWLIKKMAEDHLFKP